MKKHTIYLEIGGNLENRFEYLEKTKQQVEAKLGKVVKCSSIYETPPWGFSATHNFLNQTIKIESMLSPKILIKEIIKIEERLGRKRFENKYCSRTVDIDVLFFDDKIIQEENIEVPHPRIHLRKFVLLPLNEIAYDLIHPVYNKTIQRLLKECKDDSICTVWTK